MTTLLMILGGCLIGLGVGLMSTDRTELKKRNPKKKVRSTWDKDPFFGTPLEDFSKLKKKRWTPRYSPQKHVFNKD